MHRRNKYLAGAALALAAAPAAVAAIATAPAAVATVAAAPAAAGTPQVSVRVEGGRRTLLPATVVRAPSAAVVKGGHSCPGASGMGAFNKAVKGRWAGTWSTSLQDFDVMTILGDSEIYSKTKTYWALFVNNVTSSVGICGVKLHPGEKILFAAVGATESPGDPISVTAPARGRTHRSIPLHIVYYDGKGKTHRLRGVTVSVAGRSHGPTSLSVDHNANYGLTASTPGRYKVTVSKTGYVRDETTITVTR